MNQRACTRALHVGGLLLLSLTWADAAPSRTARRANYTPEPEASGRSGVAAQLEDHERRLGRLEQVTFNGTRSSAPSTAKAPPRKSSPPASSTAKSGSYQVRSGDNLTKISQKTGVSIKRLLAANSGLRESSVLRPGQTLRLPGGTASPAPEKVDPRAAAATPTPSGSGRYGHSTTARPPGKHTVKSGDTLYALSRKYGVSESDLRKANNLGTKSKLKVGATLVIPGAEAVAAEEVATAPALPALPEGWQWHQVQQGEGLSHIAARYDSDRRAIEHANDLQGSAALREGMYLRIPPASHSSVAGRTRPNVMQRLPESGEEMVLNYQVQKGDTVAALAEVFRTTPADIRRLNRLAATEEVVAGNHIVVPNGIFEVAQTR